MQDLQVFMQDSRMENVPFLVSFLQAMSNSHNSCKKLASFLQVTARILQLILLLLLLLYGVNTPKVCW